MFTELCGCIQNGYRDSSHLKQLVGKDKSSQYVFYSKRAKNEKENKIYKISSSYDAKTIKKLKDFAASMNIPITVEEDVEKDLTI